MDDFTFKVPNLAEFERRCLALGTKGARRAGKKATRQGINVILIESRRLAKAGHPNYPARLSGLMARSIHVRDHGVIGDNIVFSVDVKRLAFYARFLEYGTSHARAYPFMRPAAENKARIAVYRLAEVLGPAIEYEWGRKVA
jgi:HK97 gp10 family phage protein